ncbi:unnamed protein product, partial [Prorocentrum cordatum]
MAVDGACHRPKGCCLPGVDQARLSPRLRGPRRRWPGATGARRMARPPAVRPVQPTIGKRPAAKAAISRGQVTKRPAAARAVAKRPAATSVKRFRHDGLAQMLKEEAASWAGRLADDDLGEGENGLECPFCARMFERKDRARDRAWPHAAGKLSCLHATLIDDWKQVTHPVLASIVRALHDHDVVTASEKRGMYASRARKLIVQWARFSALPGARRSMYSIMGNYDGCMVLALTAEGPVFWLRGDQRLEGRRQFGEHNCTMDFANAYARQLLGASGVHGKAFRAVVAEWLARGCEVTALANRHSQTMSALALDIMKSDAMRSFVGSLKVKVADLGGLRSLSVDATYRVALKVDGRSSYDKHNVFTVLGFHGERAVPAALRDRVEHVAADVVGHQLVASMREIFPNLMGISLDPMHLCFSADRHFVKRRMRPTVAGLVLRSVTGKFSHPDSSRSREPFFDGTQVPHLTAAERAHIGHIEQGDLQPAAAARALKAMDPNVPMRSRIDFCRLLASFVAVYPDRLDTKYDKVTFREQLVAARRPSRAEWFFNNVRYRSRLTVDANALLGTGTTRSKQAHAALNSDFRQTLRVSQEMLAAELRTWGAMELALARRALAGRTTVRVKHASMRPFVVASTQLFEQASWSAHLKCAQAQFESFVPE